MDAALELRIRIQGTKDVIAGFQSVQAVKHLYVFVVLVKTTSNTILTLIIVPYGLSLYASIFIKRQSKSKRLKKKSKTNASFTNCQEAAKGNCGEWDKGMS